MPNKMKVGKTRLFQTIAYRRVGRSVTKPLQDIVVISPKMTLFKFEYHNLTLKIE